MFEEGFAVAGEVVLFEGGGGEEGFAVEEAGELGEDVFALLEEGVLVDWVGGRGGGSITFSRSSWICDSVFVSSSVGF